jgi:hypothetical protein
MILQISKISKALNMKIWNVQWKSKSFVVGGTENSWSFQIIKMINYFSFGTQKNFLSQNKIFWDNERIWNYFIFIDLIIKLLFHVWFISLIKLCVLNQADIKFMLIKVSSLFKRFEIKYSWYDILFSLYSFLKW